MEEKAMRNIRFNINFLSSFLWSEEKLEPKFVDGSLVNTFLVAI